MRNNGKIKAIPTFYKGYHFRSRLEARWAVFFDALEIEWEYEKEGFELPGGTRYLPDFWLPQVNMWCEVKPYFPDGEGFWYPDNDAEAYSKASSLYELTGFDVLWLIGVPGYRSYYTVAQEEYVLGTDYIYGHDEHRFYCCPGAYGNPSDYDMHAVYCPHGIRGYGCEHPYSKTPYQDAVNAARSARFEFGESGATK